MICECIGGPLDGEERETHHGHLLYVILDRPTQATFESAENAQPSVPAPIVGVYEVSIWRGKMVFSYRGEQQR